MFASRPRAQRLDRCYTAPDGCRPLAEPRKRAAVTRAQGVAPHTMVVPQPPKHLYLSPKILQSVSNTQVVEQALPAEVQPPSPLTTGRERHEPELHSSSVVQEALAGLLVLAVELLHAKVAMVTTHAAKMDALFMGSPYHAPVANACFRTAVRVISARC